LNATYNGTEILQTLGVLLDNDEQRRMLLFGAQEHY
jgi:hypothetical protein